MQADKDAWQEKYDSLEKRRDEITGRMDYLEGLLDFHNEKYEPYHKVNAEYKKYEKPISDAVVNLAKVEVLNHNKRDLERMLDNERHSPTRTITRKSNEPSL